MKKIFTFIGLFLLVFGLSFGVPVFDVYLDENMEIQDFEVVEGKEAFEGAMNSLPEGTYSIKCSVDKEFQEKETISVLVGVKLDNKDGDHIVYILPKNDEIPDGLDFITKVFLNLK